MDEDISGFLSSVTPYGGADLSTFSLIHTSEEGFYALYRGERAGQFRVYKCLKPQWRGQELQEAMLRKEFEIGYPLRHPGIRETYQYTAIDGLGNCIEMEWVDGVPLSEFLKQGAPDERLFLKLAWELCDALSYLHSRQTVHRDIKPSNFMVTHDGQCIKLIDFGLADSSSHALLKAPAGTRRYIAPEVLGGAAADVRSDIWSLGVVLAEMAPGRHSRVIRKCTCKDPGRRWRSVQEVRVALMRRSRWPVLAAVAGIAAAVAILLTWNSPRVPTAVPGAADSLPAAGAAADTAATVDSDAGVRPQEAAPQPGRRAKARKAQEDDELDRIVRQATDLFEDALK